MHFFKYLLKCYSIFSYFNIETESISISNIIVKIIIKNNIMTILNVICIIEKFTLTYSFAHY